jgi:hypothetical protein
MQANIDMLAELNGAPPHQGCRACRTTTGFCVRVALQVYWPACVSILWVDACERTKPFSLPIPMRVIG